MPETDGKIESFQKGKKERFKPRLKNAIILFN